MNSSPSIRGIVHVVDDDAGLRTALDRLLSAVGHEPHLYASAAEYLAADCDAGPACLLLDLRMPGATGLDLQKKLIGRKGAHPIVFLSGHGSIPSTVQAMQNGAVDFLTKPVARDKLLAAVNTALERDSQRRARAEYLADVRDRYELLTHRERQVMAGVVAGLLNKQICYALGTAERTIKTHRARVIEKMQAKSVPDLVRLCDELREAGVSMESVPIA